MEDKIESERMGRDITKITELNLDNCKSATVVGLSENWSSLEKLSLINVGLTSLDGFPKLKNLTKLKLCDNRLSDGFKELTVLPSLTHLNLSGNKITEMKNLSPLSKIKSLLSLNLVSCDISSQDSYKEKIFALLPNLVYLDGFDKDEHPEIEVCNDGDLANDVEEDDLDEEEDELDEEEDEDDSGAEEEDEDIPLEAIYNKSYTNDTADDDDFEVIEDEEEVDEEIDEEEDEEDEENEANVTPLSDAEGKSRGIKRKLENEEVQQNGKSA